MNVTDILRRVPLVRRPFYQRDVARAERDRLALELAEMKSQAASNLARLPWYSIDLPVALADGRGMIFDDERRLLYTLARSYYSGAGRIIDGGTFIGDSSLALGHGLKTVATRHAR